MICTVEYYRGPSSPIFSSPSSSLLSPHFSFPLSPSLLLFFSHVTPGASHNCNNTEHLQLTAHARSARLHLHSRTHAEGVLQRGNSGVVALQLSSILGKNVMTIFMCMAACVCLSVRRLVRLITSLYVCQSIHLLLYLKIVLFVYASYCLSIWLYVRLSVHSSGVLVLGRESEEHHRRRECGWGGSRSLLRFHIRFLRRNRTRTSSASGKRHNELFYIRMNRITLYCNGTASF